jgi:transcriptional regulator of acetoin/glycerol metabolism
LTGELCRQSCKEFKRIVALRFGPDALGETGTGKELIARAIHERSRRKERAFVRLNCAAIPTGLLESELFGHERGAFTGAIAQKIGRLELADQGTLFLDEVGDIPIEIQPKLLRALQEREFERLGSNRTNKVNARLVGATNRDLETMMENREFRSDLYYRLNVFPIRIPPLRERPEDIPLLVRYFAQKYSRRMQKQIEYIPAAALRKLSSWHWAGNIRELENFIERSVILTQGSELQTPIAELSYKGRNASVTGTREANEHDEIVRTLKGTRGRVGGPDGAAARMGIKRTTLISRMKKLGIDRARYREPVSGAARSNSERRRGQPGDLSCKGRQMMTCRLSKRHSDSRPMAFEKCLLHPHQNPPQTAYVNYSASVGVWHQDGLPCSSESWTHEVEIRREIPTAVTKQVGACCCSPAAICYWSSSR